MNNPVGQSTGGAFNSTLVPVQDTGRDWTQSAKTDSTGGGGGNTLEPRVVALETHIDHIRGDIVTIKDDIRDMRNIGVGVVIAVFLAFIGLYVYIGSETNNLGDKFNAHNLDVTNKFNEIQNRMGKIESQNEDAIDGIHNLTETVNKLVGIQVIGKE